MNPKILITTGTHDNEEYAKFLFRKLKETLTDENYEFFTFDHYVSGNDRSRTVNINLNRMSDVDRLFSIADDIVQFENALQYADIHLDIHNSPNCLNLNLISYTENSNKDFMNWVSKNNLLYIFRETNFKSLSTQSRDLGKISTTIEINGMNPFDISPERVQEDLDFILKTIEDCIGFFNQNTEGTNIYSLNNELQTVKLRTKSLVDVGFDEFVINKDEIEFLSQPKITLSESIKIKPVAVDSVFEGCTLECLVYGN